MPTVAPAAARKQIAGGDLHPVYLLVGDDERTIGSLAAAIADTLDEALRAFNYERLHVTDKGMSPTDVIEAARVVPMMSPRRVVAVMRAEAWLKPRRAAAEDPETGDPAAGAPPEDRGAFAPLVEYVKAPIETTTLVFVASDVSRTSPLGKALYNHATVVECWGLVDRDAPRGGDVLRQALALVKEAAAASGRQIDPAAAQLLAERSGGDIGKLRADVDHALLFAQGRRAVTRADVEAVVGERGTLLDPWAIVNEIERGNAAAALRHLATAIEEGAAPVMVLGQLGWFVREKLSRVRPQQVPAAIQAVFRTDLDLKSSGGDPRVLLERLVLELCGRKK